MDGLNCCGVASAAPPPSLSLTLVRNWQEKRDWRLRHWKRVEWKKNVGLLFLGLVGLAAMTSMWIWVFEMESEDWRR